MRNLSQILTDDFSVSFNDLEKALSYQEKYGGQIEQILVSLGSLSSELLPQVYAKLFNLPLLTEQAIGDWVVPTLPEQYPVKQFLNAQWVPYQVDNNKILFATSAPLHVETLELLNSLQTDFEIVLASPDVLHFLVSKTEQSLQSEIQQSLTTSEESRLRELASEAPTVNLLNSLISRALRQRASDMHIEPSQGRGKVRFRIDGVLQDVESIPPALILPVITRLKILSNMDIAEKRRPQDGKIEMRISGMDLDIRVSALPLNEGESIVMRFLRKDAINYDMKILGIAPDIEQHILQDIQTTAGVVLLTGPTGSGKTTSLYTFLNKLNTPGVKIITLEDPVEYQLNGINQVQVQPDIGFDFAVGLRSIVRQDPDIIMLGEIRDKETAGIAMQSALTGHLVFSTVHTNDAPSAYTRLLDLGVEEFLLNAALVSIVAQRLVRRLCPHCAAPDSREAQYLERYNLIELAEKWQLSMSLRRPVGCEKCNHQGYLGRVAIIEYLRCDDVIKALPKDQHFIQEARAANQLRGGRTLVQDGLLKAIQGITTVDEVMRVAG